MNIDRATSDHTLLKHREPQSGPPVRSSEIVVPQPDCCAEWTRSARRLNVTVVRVGGMRSEPDASIRFCPWCGRARHNNQGEPQPPTTGVADRKNV